MHSDQQPYRNLHDAMLGGEDDEAFRPASLAAWLDNNAGEALWLQSFRERSGPQTSVSYEDLWRLYALSRVIQLMTLSFQPLTPGGLKWEGPGLSLQDFSAFARILGLTVTRPNRFSPFDCEIVTVTETAARNEEPSLLDVHWPCLMLGEMLLCRAGTSIRTGAAIMDASVASSSTLYWAFRRKTRPYQDLSRGWGSNSQWRTTFRRDYRVGHTLHFNVDGKHDLAANDLPPDPDDDEPLTRQERIELLTHRCFVVTDKPHNDRWPYDDKLTINT